VTDEQMAANPQLVKSMSVSPPMGFVVCVCCAVHDVDLQPAAARTWSIRREIGCRRVVKIEKKSARLAGGAPVRDMS